MNRVTVICLVALSGCLDSLTLFPEAPAVVERERPRQEVLDTGSKVFDAGEGELDAGGPLEVQDAGVAVTDGGATCVVGTLTNCGACGDVCATVANADATCSAGRCGRGPCRDGFFDLDPSVDGCETACTGNVCTGPRGTVTLTSPPVSERAHGLFSTTGTSVGAERGVLGQQGGAQAAGTVSHRSWFH